MKLKNSASLAAICAGLLGATLLAAPAQAQKYNKLVVFGDSLSDNGNLALFHAAPPPPYSDGRFSNGDVWTQQLGFGELNGFGNVNGSTDFAFGGAETGTATLPPGLQTLVQTLSTATQGKNITLTIDQAMQYWAESALETELAASGATNGTAIIGRPSTGEILAMANVTMVNGVPQPAMLTIWVARLPMAKDFGWGFQPNFSSGRRSRTFRVFADS